MRVFLVVYVKDGKQFIWDYKPSTLDEALRVGHELTRDYVADFFRVQRH